MDKISIVIPVYNEQEVIKECYKRIKEIALELREYEHEIIFVDDGSEDETLQFIEKFAKKDFNVKAIKFTRNFGHQAAVTAGLKEAVGDAIIIMDADLQDPPEVIPEMLELWKSRI